MFDHVGIQDGRRSAARIRCVLPARAQADRVLPRSSGILVGTLLAVGIAGRKGFPLFGFWIGPAGGQETRELHVAFTR